MSSNENVCEKITSAIFEEVEGAEEYFELAEKVKAAGDLSFAKELCEMARQELGHFEKLHGYMSKSYSEEQKRNCFSGLHDKMASDLTRLKAEIEGFKV